MSPEPSLLSPPLRLDLANEQLWQGARAIPLRPKSFALLRCLVEHPGQLLTKAALFNAIWPETAVSDVVLTVCIRELRQALDDDVKMPRFIETVRRRGYRFVGRVTALPEPGAARQPGLLLQIAPKSLPLSTQHSALLLWWGARLS
jgi:DNA-binding winged helix-turn-helix (wHTH) protein